MRTKTRERRRVTESMRRVALFERCSDEELAAVDRLASELSVEEGRTLISQGSGGLEFMVVVDGWACVTRDGEQIAMVGPGSFVGELSLIDQSPRNATVTAATPMRLWVFHVGEFATLLERAPCVKRAIETASIERRKKRTPAARVVAPARG